MLRQDVIDALVSIATQKKVKLELLYTFSNSTSTRIFESNVDAVKQTQDACVGIRVVNESFSEGCAYSERLDIDALVQALNEAIENAKICKPLYQVDLFEPMPLSKRQTFYHGALEKVQLQQMTELGLKLDALARSIDERIINVPYVIVSIGSGGKSIVNNLGLNLEDKANHCSIYLGVTAEANGIKKTGGAFDAKNDFSLLEVDRVAKEAVENATSLLNPQPLEKPGSYPIIFNPECFADLIDCFDSLFDAKMVLEGKSLLKNKIGELISSNIFTLIDDPTIADGLSSMNFDAEGVEANPVTLIDRGVLKNYLHNSVTALQMKTQTNGRASRSPKSSLGISRSNWVVKCQNTVSLDTLLLMHDMVIEVVDMQGLHAGVNPISGDFSLMADGFLWKNGKKQHALQPFTVAGNILTLLQDIEACSDNIKQTATAIITGSVCIKSLAVSGS